MAKHLAAVGELLHEDPERALEHARAVRARAGRIGLVREAAGIAAYHAGEWSEALAELRAARRITGDPRNLPVMADCERALGRPDRALALGTAEEVAALDAAARVELRIVHSGARRDLGEVEAALLLLQGAGLDRANPQPWSARLWYAYADLLLAAGRTTEAREWFLAAALADADGETDADERLDALDGGSADGEGADGGDRDGQLADGSVGADPVGAGAPGAGAPDGGAPDGGAPDGGAPDGGAPDGGAQAAPVPPPVPVTGIFQEPQPILQEPQPILQEPQPPAPPG